ncbi:uncharacterized protein Z518_10062 [Rhinocladiella mackenziei CBS 650.93]|uniref:Uncharacterized protein n=1 Tax=Rhinocladiella mackenziei CBS 650.93 TaxID=1442369 RepID=A0A0D2ICN5_9EURO|nr:uncharacterized protein Z518_10062 [Rhinocladiella mackenziei CBS 650.93]KIX00996.1 hypothetical protein Z518_10062 [Rhinocladiella mackenziei CBS 650.93]
MASFFISKQQLNKTKAVPHGGLGGLVSPGGGDTGGNDADAACESRWTKSKRRRPPPIQIASGLELSPISPAQISAASSLGFGGLWTPKTPTDRNRSRSLIGGDANEKVSPLISRYDSAAPCQPHCSPPQTPMSPRVSQTSLPAELPGSLLLPSQGFPQTNPISPPPSIRVLRRDTGDSSLSSARTLSTSASTDEENMETLRHLTTPLRKNDRFGTLSITPATTGDRPIEASRITRPFSAMGMEELLARLPELNPSTISQLWLPAFRIQFQKMTAVLQDATEVELDSSLDRIALQKDLQSFSDGLRVITASYHKVVESAESVAERDTKNRQERLKELEVQVEEALESIGAKDKEIAHQERKNTELKHTIHEVVRVLGAFIHDHVPDRWDSINESRTQEVLQIISDYARHADNKSVRYLRVPEATVAQYVRDLQELQNLIDYYRKVSHSQAKMINQQSESLDAYVDKYETAVNLVKEREHEILLLTQHNKDLAKQVERYEEELIQTREAHTEAELMVRQYEELRGSMESLKMAHALELDQRDAENANLRQKLGSAREEVFARREDVKNILTQARNMLQSTDTSTAKSRNASKALRFLGMEQDKKKIKKPGLPSSQSMMGLSKPAFDSPTWSSDSRYSSKEVTTDEPTLLRNRSLQNRFRSQTNPNAPVDGSTGSTDCTLPLSVVRPRSDTLGATQRHDELGSPINTDKDLPKPPTQLFPSFLSAARLAEITQSIDSPTEAQIASDYFKHGIIGQTSTRRVLSNIPEVPVYNASEADIQQDKNFETMNEKDSDSVDSSDREVYRKSICALDMLNSSTLLDNETATSLERILRGRTRSEPSNSHIPTPSDQSQEPRTGVARVLQLRPGNGDLRDATRERDRDFDREERVRQSLMSDSSGYRTEDSEPQTVTQMYHQGRRHIRG